MNILKVSKLKNGPLILSSKTNDAFNVDAYVKTKTNKEEVPGTAHFVEHMILSGKNQSGYTTREYTAYNFENVPIPQVVRWLTCPDFNEKTLDYEQKRIFRERNSNFENMVDKAHLKALKMDSVLGKLEHVGLDNIKAFHKKHYVPNNFIFHVHSKKSHKHVLSQFKKCFNIFKTTKNITSTFVPTINLMIKNTRGFLSGKLSKLNDNFLFVKSIGHKDLRFDNFLKYLNDLNEKLKQNSASLLYFPYINNGVLCFNKCK